MVHQIEFNSIVNKTMCGIIIKCPISNIDPYDERTIVDINGLIVTGFGFGHTDTEPTCAECSRLKQQSLYHCSVHGYLEGIDVTFNETCVYCGNGV